MTDINKAFLTKQAAMILIGPWMINSALRQEGCSSTRPASLGFRTVCVVGMTHQLVLGKQPDRAKQLAAMKFIRYMSENSMTWVKGGQAPAGNRSWPRPSSRPCALERLHAGIQPEAGWTLNPPIKAQTKVFTHDPASPSWPHGGHRAEEKTLDQA